MKVILKGKRLLEMSGLENAHQLTMRSRVSHPTVDRYVNRPEKVIAVDLRVLIAILVDGCDLSIEQVKEIKLGDLLEIEP